MRLEEVRKEARDWVRRSVEQSIRLVERKRRAAGESSEDEAARERDDDDEQGRSLDRERSLVRVEATDEEQREVDQATSTLRMSRIRATWPWRDHRMKLDLKMEREGNEQLRRRSRGEWVNFLLSLFLSIFHQCCGLYQQPTCPR